MELLLHNTRDIAYNCFFRFSDEFVAEFKHRTGIQLEPSIHSCTRKDPTAIAIFKEKGAVWSSYDWFDDWYKIKNKGIHDPSYQGTLKLVTVPECMVRHFSIEESGSFDEIIYYWDEAYKELLFAFADGAIDKSTLLRRTAEIATFQGAPISKNLQSYLLPSAPPSSFTVPVEDSSPNYFT